MPASNTARILAFSIDAALLAGLFFSLVTVLALSTGMAAAPAGSAAILAVLALVLLASPVFLPLLYFTILHAFGGQTLGKLFFGLRVVTTSGSPLSAAGAFLRACGLLFSLAPFGAGCLWFLIRRDHAAWHDLLADSRVVSCAANFPLDK